MNDGNIEKLREILTDLKFSVELDGLKSLLPEESRLIVDALDIPKHETVSEWEARTGKTYPDEEWVSYIDLVDYVQFKKYKKYKLVFIKTPAIVATHHGKPS